MYFVRIKQNKSQGREEDTELDEIKKKINSLINKLIPKGMSRKEAEKYIRFLAIPLIIIILLTTIIVLDTTGRKGRQQTPDNETESTSGFTTAELTRNSDPAILELVNKYFNARLESDVETVDTLFGREAASEDVKESEAEVMKQEVEHIESFENINCYMRPGIDENSVLIYVEYDIKFLATDTLAPGLLWLYVWEDSDGNYIIKEELDETESEFIAFSEQTEDVKMLVEKQNQGLREALSSDSKLANIYQLLEQGASETETSETETSGAEAPGTETTEADETEPAETTETQTQ